MAQPSARKRFSKKRSLQAWGAMSSGIFTETPTQGTGTASGDAQIAVTATHFTGRSPEARPALLEELLCPSSTFVSWLVTCPSVAPVHAWTSGLSTPYPTVPAGDRAPGRPGFCSGWRFTAARRAHGQAGLSGCPAPCPFQQELSCFQCLLREAPL